MAVSEKDPGVGGAKLSKSGGTEEALENRNKSYEKVLDLLVLYVRARQEGRFDEIANALYRWKNKSEWHEKTYGW